MFKSTYVNAKCIASAQTTKPDFTTKLRNTYTPKKDASEPVEPNVFEDKIVSDMGYLFEYSPIAITSDAIVSHLTKNVAPMTKDLLSKTKTTLQNFEEGHIYCTSKASHEYVRTIAQLIDTKGATENKCVQVIKEDIDVTLPMKLFLMMISMNRLKGTLSLLNDVL